MEFEPTSKTGFKPAIQARLNRFEPARSNRKTNLTVRHLTSELTVFYKKTARTTLRIVSRAVSPVLRTATALTNLECRREGGSK